MVWWVSLQTKLSVLFTAVSFQGGLVAAWWVQGAPGGWHQLLQYAAQHEYAMLLYATLVSVGGLMWCVLFSECV